MRKTKPRLIFALGISALAVAFTWTLVEKKTISQHKHWNYLLATMAEWLCLIIHWETNRVPPGAQVPQVEELWYTVLNTEHWNTKCFEVLFSNGPKTSWPTFFLFFNGPGHWKTKLLATLDHFIYKHDNFSIAKSLFSMVRTMRKQNKMATILSTIGKLNKPLPFEFQTCFGILAPTASHKQTKISNNPPQFLKLI